MNKPNILTQLAKQGGNTRIGGAMSKGSSPVSSNFSAMQSALMKGMPASPASKPMNIPKMPKMKYK